MFSCDIEPTFYVTNEQKARKEHPCCECRAPIRKGEVYLECRGKWDGSISTHRQHLLCAEACMLIRDKFEFECIPFGMLKEWVHEWKQEMPAQHRQRPEVIALRSLMAKIFWREYKGKP